MLHILHVQIPCFSASGKACNVIAYTPLSKKKMGCCCLISILSFLFLHFCALSFGPVSLHSMDHSVSTTSFFHSCLCRNIRRDEQWFSRQTVLTVAPPFTTSRPTCRLQGCKKLTSTQASRNTSMEIPLHLGALKFFLFPSSNGSRARVCGHHSGKHARSRAKIKCKKKTAQKQEQENPPKKTRTDSNNNNDSRYIRARVKTSLVFSDFAAGDAQPPKVYG